MPEGREDFPLFCTAQVPPKASLCSPSNSVSALQLIRSSKVIDDLLQKSDAGYGNVWSLVKTSDQKTFEKPTEPPVSEFTTSFESASLDTLGEFCKTHSSDDLTTFAVLDERSIQDSTVLLVKWELWDEYIGPDGGDDESNRKDCEGWQTLRVRFEKAADLMSGLDYIPVNEFNSNPQGFDENGVYKG